MSWGIFRGSIVNLTSLVNLTVIDIALDKIPNDIDFFSIAVHSFNAITNY